jgi:3-oxoacyl-[acyl-carrier protein] reductase
MTAETTPGGPAAHRTALVTGGTRGIGLAITRGLLARGCNVGAASRSGGHPALAAAGAAGAAAATGHGDALLGVRHDLADPPSAGRTVGEVLARWGRLDSLILNAGVYAAGRLDELDPGEWWRIVDTNVQGMARLVRAALPALRQAPDASIVIVSSVVALIGFPGDTAYATAKSAMIGFGRSLAKETARHGIRVNVLAPGFVETGMTAAVPQEARRRIAQAITLRRFGTADEISRAAVFLSEDATYCTGTVLTVDGGWSL